MAEVDPEVPASLPPLQRTLGRLQLLQPLSLLIFIGAALISALAAKPSLRTISDEYLTILTPSTPLIGLYWLVIFVLLLGQSFLLVFARKEETKLLLVHGVGSRLGLINIVMALWVLFWTLKLFLAAEIALFVAILLAFTIHLTLLRHPPTSARPIDTVLVHVPARMILSILLNVDVWQNGLLALGWYHYIGEDPNVGHGKWESEHGKHNWIAFGVVLGLALLNGAYVFATTDIPYAASTIYLSVALSSKSKSKPPQVFITIILGAALVFVALISSIGWRMIQDDREGAIRLEDEEGGEEDGTAV
ncbi:hypothetical protein MNV49_006501 [Pseudohyphozyma bogoriensis]|nr:hypothetical protein MNV49_006501 [Pseudohyphozyma bogoriensis]